MRQAFGADEEWKAESMDQAVDSERATRKQWYLRCGDRPRIRIAHRRFPKEDIGAVMPEDFVDLVRMGSEPSAD
ncbi:hypothetical protein D3C87_1964610 [compost metagenome]